jgi:hypothetical protein
MDPPNVNRNLYPSQNGNEESHNGNKKIETQKLGGNLWITGKTEEDSLKKTERALG